MTEPEAPHRSVWPAMLLIVTGALVLAIGVGAVYFSGICGFQADPAEADACARRWRVSGGITAVVGALAVAFGVRSLVARR